MTIVSDGQGNHFLGDCIYANHDIGYPAIDYLEAFPVTGLSAEITALCTAAGLNYRNVMSQASMDTDFTTDVVSGKSILRFGAAADTIDDRYSINCYRAFTNAGGGGVGTEPAITLFNDSGDTSITETPSDHNDTNVIATTIQNRAVPWNFVVPSTTRTDLQFAATATDNSLGIVVYQKDLATDTDYINFMYAGLLTNNNTNFNYYDASNITKSFLLFFYEGDDGSVTGGQEGKHYIANAQKSALETGRANYTITCTVGGPPAGNFSTKAYFFDDNATIGNPAMGIGENLLLATGSFTKGKPVVINTTEKPDTGHNHWLPIGTWAGKTLLFRVYSSVT